MFFSKLYIRNSNGAHKLHSIMLFQNTTLLFSNADCDFIPSKIPPLSAKAVESVNKKVLFILPQSSFFIATRFILSATFYHCSTLPNIALFDWNFTHFSWNCWGKNEYLSSLSISAQTFDVIDWNEKEMKFIILRLNVTEKLKEDWRILKSIKFMKTTWRMFCKKKFEITPFCLHKKTFVISSPLEDYPSKTWRKIS